MLRQLITSMTARPASGNAARLQPAELREIIQSLPEVAQVVRARARVATRQSQPRSVCTSLKDLCEF